MRYTAYVIQNPKGILYKGHTIDIPERLKQHNRRSQGQWTSLRGPWKIVYAQEFESKKEAIMHERFLKTENGREYLKQKINGV